MVRPDGAKSARVIQVIETKSKRGLGTEKDPVREIIQYWDFEGNFLAEFDPDPQYLSDFSDWELNRIATIVQDSRS